MGIYKTSLLQLQNNDGEELGLLQTDDSENNLIKLAESFIYKDPDENDENCYIGDQFIEFCRKQNPDKIYERIFINGYIVIHRD